MPRTIRDEDRFEATTIENVTCTRETEAAILCLVDGEEYWIPKSQIDDDSEVYEKGHEGKLVIPKWLATDKGLV